MYLYSHALLLIGAHSANCLVQIIGFAHVEEEQIAVAKQEVLSDITIYWVGVLSVNLSNFPNFHVVL